MWTFSFLSPGWLGLALLGALGVAAMVPARLRSWWVVALGGGALASLAALLGLVPWLGELHATGYAVMLVLAFVAAYLVTIRPARLVGIPEKQLLDLVLCALLGGIVGARIGEVVEQWPGFAQDAAGRWLPWNELLSKAADIDGGGMVWYGGALLGGLLMLLYARWQRMGLLPLFDLFFPGAMLGLAIGRIGCFLNGCCYGRPTTLPWCVEGAGGHCTHPTQLYETAACLALFAILAWCWRRRRWQGQVTLIAILSYSGWRFFNEALRGDTVMTTFWGLFPLTTSQAMSLNLAIVTTVVSVIVTRHRRRDRLAQRAAADVPGSRNQQSASPEAGVKEGHITPSSPEGPPG